MNEQQILILITASISSTITVIVTGIIAPWLESRRRKEELILSKTFDMYLSSPNLRRAVRDASEDAECTMLEAEAMILNCYFVEIKNVVYGTSLPSKIKKYLITPSNDE